MRLSKRLSGWRGLALIVVAAGCLLGLGCVNRDVTRENFDKIKTGMTLQEVEALIGPPDARVKGSGCRGCTLAGDYCYDDTGRLRINSGQITWMENNRSITLQFSGGRVAAKEQSGLGK
jgi:hypothetical protein